MSELSRPRWIVAHIAVLLITVVFVNLGLWQLRRLDQVRTENAVAASRYLSPPADLQTLLDSVGEDTESLRYRRVTLTGRYDPDYELLTRNQVYQGIAGFHVITPLVPASGPTVLVNRGWVPLELDTPPIDEAPPPAGEVTATGWISLTQVRPPLGPTDPGGGTLDILSRVDIARIQDQVPYQLAPVYVVIDDGDELQLPVPVALPGFNDDGPHLAYSVQWFGFTLIGLVGYGFLIRRALRPRGARPE
ncbi:MAG: SURF1 family protein [Acidimicrobiia bacterium]|nr:SURF1 family protein [Acidimicrobiia bacterium]MDH3463096.1 SURF1 family protein [Acidimicrobiia bacterium]